MSLTRTPRRQQLATAMGVILLAALPLSGCGGGDSPSVKDVLDIADGEGNIDTDGDGKDDLSIDREGDGVTIGDGDSSLALDGEIPEDFPDDVPLIDGDVVQGGSYAAGASVGWTVAINHDGALPAAVDRVADELAGAGFSELSRFAAEDGAVLSVMKDDFTVGVTFAIEDGGTLVAYTVGRSAPTS